jgi:hypothetical protein
MATDKSKAESTDAAKKVIEIGSVIASMGAIASPDDLHGRYCNLAIIQHTKNEYVLDFLLNLNDQIMLVSRVLMSPDHAMRLYDALGRNLKDFEKKYGKIKTEKKGKSDS